MKRIRLEIWVQRYFSSRADPRNPGRRHLQGEHQCLGPSSRVLEYLASPWCWKGSAFRPARSAMPDLFGLAALPRQWHDPRADAQ